MGFKLFWTSQLGQSEKYAARQSSSFVNGPLIMQQHRAIRLQPGPFDAALRYLPQTFLPRAKSRQNKKYMRIS
jgi:hypothetical protein